MLYIESQPDTFSRWTGGKIGEILMPKASTVEANWSADELAAVGLWRSSDMIAAADPGPEGQIITGTGVSRIDGVVRFVNTYGDPPPAPPRTIHPAWLRLALIELAMLDAVNAAVASQGAAKSALWEYATTLSEADPDIVAIAGALEIDLAALFTRAGEIRDERNA